MALDASRGLPTFSEMYGAYKARGNLGDLLKAGMEGYQTGSKIKAGNMEAKSQADLRTAQGNEANAKADSLRGGNDEIPLAALPAEIQPQLQQFAKQNANGIFVVPKSAATVALGTTEQGRKTKSLEDQLNAQQERFEEQKRHAQEVETLQKELNDIRESSGDDNRKLTAAKTVAETASREPKPNLLERGLSAGKEMLGGDPLNSVLAERQAAAARAQLAQQGGLNIPDSTMAPAPMSPSAPAPAITPAAPHINAVRSQAISALREAGQPLTDANIKEAIRQLGGGK